MKIKQYAIVRTPDELAYMDAEWYFDNDGFKAESGDYNNTLFIVPTRDCGGFNADEWEQLDKAADFIIDAFDEMGGNYATYNSFKEAVEDCPYFPVEVKYSPKLIHDLKEWWKKARCYNDNTEDIAALLTIITGKKWDIVSARGYSQGDYCEVVYCTERYSEKSAQAAGEVFVGAFTSFEVIDLNENGEEIDRCGGYVVAECEGAWRDEDCKRLVCEWADIDEAETYFGEEEWQEAVEQHEEEQEQARINGDYHKEAQTIAEAIKKFAEDKEALDNFEDYLARHFYVWMQKWAHSPAGLADEFKSFANMFVK